MIYLGAGLVVAGSVLSVVAWALFAVSEGQPHTSGPYWAYREAAVVTAGLGAVGLLVGGVRLATAVGSIHRAVVASTVVGIVLSFLAVGVFVASYPGAWNVAGTDYSLPGVTAYGAGIACLAGAFAAAVRSRVRSS